LHQEFISVFRFALAALLAATSPAVVLAQSPDTYRQAFDAIQQAVAEGDSTAFADWVSYPIEVMADGQPMVIGDADEFAAHYSAIVIPEIAGAVADQSFNDLFVNAEGAMFGDGQVWMSEICLDDACSDSEVKIITIQSTAQ
jgi:hypothetical protein